jgi:hypothetical protein
VVTRQAKRERLPARDAHREPVHLTKDTAISACEWRDRYETFEVVWHGSSVRRTQERPNAMSKPDEYPAGVPCWVETLQPDPRAALGFYGSVFGWEFSQPAPMPAGLPGEYFIASVDDHAVARIGTLPDLGG